MGPKQIDVPNADLVSFTGLEPMGLFWSLLPAPGQERGTRFVKQDATEPAEFSFSVYNDHLDCEALRTMQPVAATTAQKWFMRPGDVERIEVHSGRVRGVLFKPRGLLIAVM